eukprot:TRINITY_DN7292_c0_g1_i2.p1 TRINITY_DN7292_c0_g1~~TRINITY_DN7292_c0_g1_i2.p1  ORF type:complete len:396 (+),score=26.34 TRINITY_DN7292_c0_g1_i2:270-1457(+)
MDASKTNTPPRRATMLRDVELVQKPAEAAFGQLHLLAATIAAFSVAFGTALLVDDIGLVVSLYCVSWFLVSLTFALSILYPSGRICGNPNDSDLPPLPAAMAEFNNGATNPKDTFGIEFQDTTIAGSDQGKAYSLRAWYVPRQHSTGGRASAGTTTCVVFAHSAGLDRRAYLPHLEKIHKAGYAALLFDFRAHGLSDGRNGMVSYGPGECLDLNAVIEHVRTELGHVKVVVVASTNAAAAAIQLAARNNEPTSSAYVQGLVLESPYLSRQHFFRHLTCSYFGLYSYGLGYIFYLLRFMCVAIVNTVLVLSDQNWCLDPFECMHQVRARGTLFIHGEEDVSVPVEHSKVLNSLTTCPRQLWVAKGAAHNGTFAAHPHEWASRVTDFLANIDRSLYM